MWKLGPLCAPPGLKTKNSTLDGMWDTPCARGAGGMGGDGGAGGAHPTQVVLKWRRRAPRVVREEAGGARDSRRRFSAREGEGP